ncbi:MAG: Wzz/FepE/Etk N-terminal domain-containing protein [Anaerolineae bacterium]|nr:Wzz/FepE/Etk N-terminal domain-containing protein [Anaerolineae bacterium]
MMEDGELELDLRLYWRLFVRCSWLVALAALLAGAAAYAVSRWYIEPVYAASVQLLIQPSNAYGSTDYQDILAGQRVAATYAEILQSRPVRQRALEQMGYLNVDPTDQANELAPYDQSVQSLENTQLVVLIVESTDRQFAMEFA